MLKGMSYIDRYLVELTDDLVWRRNDLAAGREVDVAAVHSERSAEWEENQSDDTMHQGASSGGIPSNNILSPRAN